MEREYGWGEVGGVAEVALVVVAEDHLALEEVVERRQPPFAHRRFHGAVSDRFRVFFKETKTKQIEQKKTPNENSVKLGTTRYNSVKTLERLFGSVNVSKKTR